jgi:hypothetical protein
VEAEDLITLLLNLKVMELQVDQAEVEQQGQLEEQEMGPGTVHLKEIMEEQVQDMEEAVVEQVE